MKPLFLLAAVASVVVLSHPSSRRALLRFAVWPVRDLLRSDWDRAARETVSDDWLRSRGAM